MLIPILLAALLPQQPPQAQSFVKFNGESDWDGYGMQVLWLDDLNADGVPEFATSAFCTDYNGWNAGSMYIFDGETRTILRRHDGGGVQAQFGRAAANTGDLDGDGVRDYIVGAPKDSVQGVGAAGSVSVFSAATGQTLFELNGTAADDQFGASVSGLGDIDADGVDDFAVGAPAAAAETGRAYLYSGADGSLIRVHAGNGLAMRCGSSIAGLDDIDGDGVRDYVVGTPGVDQDVGRAAVYSGYDGLLIYEWVSTVAEGRYGEHVRPAGDLNRDGIGDILIGEPCLDAVHVVDGATGMLLRSHFGNLAGGKRGFGHSFSTLGDWNCDGADDYVIGARGEWDEVNFQLITPGGRILVVDGLTGAALRVYSTFDTDDCFGASVAGGADLDGDGCTDLLVGAPVDGGAPGQAPGSVYLRFGPF
jgi:hypothetical protein